MDGLGVAVAALALTVSIISFEVNRRAAAKTERYSRMPVLLPKSPIHPDRITIQNMGKGTALNIVITPGSGELTERDVLDINLTDKWYSTIWSKVYHLLTRKDVKDINLRDKRYRAIWNDTWDKNKAYHLEPIESGTERCYQLHLSGLISLSYTDAFGWHYTTLTSDLGTKVIEGCTIPRKNLSALKFPCACDDRSGIPSTLSAAEH
jgi:hypothetical protein